MNSKETLINIAYAFFAICLLFLTNLNAQEKTDYKKVIAETNSLYGFNDLLHSGEIYLPEHARAKGSPYFLTNDYSPALVAVKGNVFENVTAKYNIETDGLVILWPVDSSSIKWIPIKQNQADSFKILDHLFVNISNYDSAKMLTGYFELVYRGKKSFFIKYVKQFTETYNDLLPSGFYSAAKTSFYIFDGTNFILVKNKNAFLELYSGQKTAIKKYMRANRIKFLKATSPQINKLMKFSDDLSSQN